MKVVGPEPSRPTSFDMRHSTFAVGFRSGWLFPGQSCRVGPMRCRPLSSLLVLLGTIGMFLSDAWAQTPAATPAPGAGNLNNAALPIFRAKLPGGTYEVAVRAMIAVSIHEYMVDGVARVTEVNIDTSGSMLVRFYFLEPTTPQSPMGLGTATMEKAQQLFTEAAQRTGQDLWKKVTKSYPTTTHARTAEYRVETKEQLNKVFEAAEEAFRLQRAKSVSVE